MSALESNSGDVAFVNSQTDACRGPAVRAPPKVATYRSWYQH